jgi:hypothetical protein
VATGGTSGLAGVDDLPATGGGSLGCWPVVVNGSGALLMYQTTPATAITPMTRPMNKPSRVPPPDFLPGGALRGFMSRLMEVLCSPITSILGS